MRSEQPNVEQVPDPEVMVRERMERAAELRNACDDYYDSDAEDEERHHALARIARALEVPEGDADTRRIIAFALEAFRGLLRKDGSPLVTHSLELAAKARRFGIDDPDVHRTALLHDVLEDTDRTEEDIAALDRDLAQHGIIPYARVMTEQRAAGENRDLAIVRFAEQIRAAHAIPEDRRAVPIIVELLDRIDDLSAIEYLEDALRDPTRADDAREKLITKLAKCTYTVAQVTADATDPMMLTLRAAFDRLAAHQRDAHGIAEADVQRVRTERYDAWADADAFLRTLETADPKTTIFTTNDLPKIDELPQSAWGSADPGGVTVALRKLTRMLRRARVARVHRHDRGESVDFVLPFVVYRRHDGVCRDSRITVRAQAEPNRLTVHLDIPYVPRKHDEYDRHTFCDRTVEAIIQPATQSTPTDETAPPEPFTADDVGSRDPKEIQRLADNARDIYARLIRAYVDRMQTFDAESQILSAARRALSRIREEFRATDSALVNEYTVPVTTGDNVAKRALAPYRNMTIAEASAAIDAREKAANDTDAQRWHLHRRIERFADQFLFGQSPLLVQHDLHIAYDHATDRTWPVIDRITCALRSEGSGIPDAYIIDVGTGEGSTSGSYAYDEDEDEEPAPYPEYESFLIPGNTNTDDSEIIDAAITAVRSEFPDCAIQNNVSVTGSCHEQFQYWEVIIPTSEIARFATGDHDRDAVLSRILAIFRETIERARAGEDLREK